MTVQKYMHDVLRTATGKCHNLGYAAMGMSDEVSEVIQPIREYLYQGKELNRMEVIEELGDVLWYASLTANLIGYSLEKVIKKI